MTRTVIRYKKNVFITQKAFSNLDAVLNKLLRLTKGEKIHLLSMNTECPNIIEGICFQKLSAS
jgi:hypothetical protein